MKGMVDIVRGNMSLKEINEEIQYHMLKLKYPKRLVVDIRRKKRGYYTTIYIPKKDFDGKLQKEEK